MTARERKQIERAIFYIHTDEDKGGDYDLGMTMLCNLAGSKIRPMTVKPEDYREILARALKALEKEGGSCAEPPIAAGEKPISYASASNARNRR